MQKNPFNSPLRSLVLHDVQSLFGGRVLWIDSSLTAFVQTIGAGLWEKRYQTSLSREQWAEIERLIEQHQLFSLTLPDTFNRPGVPDEARPVIIVISPSGITNKLQKWANDSHPDFDAVYSHLLALCRADGELIYQGPFDWNWRPDGFMSAAIFSVPDKLRARKNSYA